MSKYVKETRQDFPRRDRREIFGKFLFVWCWSLRLELELELFYRERRDRAGGQFAEDEETKVARYRAAERDVQISR